MNGDSKVNTALFLAIDPVDTSLHLLKVSSANARPWPSQQIVCCISLWLSTANSADRSLSCKKIHAEVERLDTLTPQRDLTFASRVVAKANKAPVAYHRVHLPIV